MKLKRENSKGVRESRKSLSLGLDFETNGSLSLSLDLETWKKSLNLGLEVETLKKSLGLSLVVETTTKKSRSWSQNSDSIKVNLGLKTVNLVSQISGKSKEMPTYATS